VPASALNCGSCWSCAGLSRQAELLTKVLSNCPDIDLAFTALTMNPRPSWVQDLVGPLSA